MASFTVRTSTLRGGDTLRADSSGISDTATVTWVTGGDTPFGFSAKDFAGGTPVHEVVGPNGSVDWPVVDDWRATETAFGGMETCSGRIAAANYTRCPDVYLPGATWFTYALETGDLMFRGELDEPIPTGGAVQLTAKGPARKLEKDVERYLLQSRRYSDWVPADGEPHGYAVTKKIEMEIRGGRIMWKPTAVTYAGGEKNGALFLALGTRLSRIAFTIKKTADDSDFELALFGANVEDGGAGVALTEITAGDPPWSMGAGNPDGTAVDYTIAGDYDLIGLYLRCSGTPTETDPERFWVKDLRINGIADDDDWTTSDTQRDIASKLNVPDTLIEESGDNMVPWDSGVTDYREPADFAAAISDWPYGAFPYGSHVAWMFRPWGRQTWTLVDPEVPRDLISQERYDRAKVPFRYADGLGRGIATAVADPNPLDIHHAAPVVEVLDHLPSEEMAEDLAQKLADYLVTRRYAGSLECVSVLSENGVRVSAQNIRAGDKLYLPDLGVKLRISQVERMDSKVRLTFPDGIPFVDRLRHRRSVRRARRGRE